jgi:hypothetical protein
MGRKLTFQSLCRIFSSQTVPKGKLQPWCRLFMTANSGWISLVTGNSYSKHKKRGSTKNQGLACDHVKHHFIPKWVCDSEGRTSSEKHLYIFCSHRRRTHCFLRRIIAYYKTTFFSERKTRPLVIICAWKAHLKNIQGICKSNYHCHFKRHISTLTYWHSLEDDIFIPFKAIPCYFKPNTTVCDN